jgi:hypothetical protein
MILMVEKSDQKVYRRRYMKYAAAGVVVVAVGGAGYFLMSNQGEKGIPVPDTEDNMKLCRCPSCPSYTGTPLTGGFYCAKGKAKEEVKKLGCICNYCPIFGKYGLKTGYFCVKGKSAEVSQ